MKWFLAAAAAALIAAPALAQSPGAAGPSASQPGGADAGAKATGQIKSVDAKAGTVTIRHGPIPTLGWPAMTMTFKATPEAMKAAKPGQTVSFTLKTPENQVVAIQPQ